jgi:hypothetical protein
MTLFGEENTQSFAWRVGGFLGKLVLSQLLLLFHFGIDVDVG